MGIEKWSWANAFILAATLAIAETKDSAVVQTSSGKVQGQILQYKNLSIAMYLGIPFAKPPLRFARPTAIDHWIDVYNATYFRPDCIADHPSNFTHDEDCLFLNIWSSPEASGDALLPVMIYIHGGGFVGGNARFPGSVFSSLSRTVVVSLNYRLNAFGFLNLYTTGASGNMGLCDQQLAISWINKNAKVFGGDPSKITLIGSSAGAASVSYHLLSSKSWPLFNRAILHSGAATDSWAFDDKVASIAKSQKLANLVGCEAKDVILNPQRALECLRKVPAQELDSMARKIEERPLQFSFVPTIDGQFIDAPPLELLSNGRFKKTEIIIGTCKNDGASFVPFPSRSQEYLSIEEAVDVGRRTYPELSDAQRVSVLLHYFGRINPDDTVGNAILVGYMIGDTGFFCPSFEFANQYNRHGGVAYYFQFDHRRSQSWIGVYHGADEDYWMGIVQVSSSYTKQEKDLSKRIIRQWRSFAETGNPSTDEFEWPICTELNGSYYRLNVGPPQIGHHPRKRDCLFWHEIGDITLPTIG